MERITIFLIAASLAMDAFAVSVSNGICVYNFRPVDGLKQGFYFGIFQFMMPLIGYFLGSSIKQYIEAIDHWIAFLLLGVIGFNMIVEASKKQENLCSNNPILLENRLLIVQAIATSIDALAVGIGFAILEVNMLQASIIIGMVAFLFSFIGGMLGKRLGVFFRQKAEIFGGLVLIFIGLKILIEHLFFS